MEIPRAGPSEVLEANELKITEDRKREILSSLAQERHQRKQQIANGSQFNLQDSKLSYELPRQPQPPAQSHPFTPKGIRSNLSKLRQNLQQSIDKTKPQNLPTPQESLQRSLQKSSTPKNFTHNQLREPDFEQLTSIYENYIKSPKACENYAPKRNVSRTPSRTQPKRPSSAPPSRKKTTEQLIKEREEKFRQECTFKPKINKLPNKKELNYNTSEKRLTPSQKLEQLCKPKTEIIEKREKLKRELEEKENEECTFRPNLTKPRERLNRSWSELPVQERLYKDAESKFNQREKRTRMKEEMEANSYPYQPQIQSSTQKLSGKSRERPPIYQRVLEVQKERNEYLQTIRKSAEEKEPNLTFKPSIDKKSQRMALIRKIKNEETNLPVSEKLSRNASQKMIRRQEEMSSEDYTFSPQISVNSEYPNPTSDFLERQKQVQERVASKRKQLLEKIQASQYTFKPQINQNSHYMTISSKERNKESQEQRYYRMSSKDWKKRTDKQNRLNEEYYSQYKFEPKINSLSKQLGRTVSLNELSNVQDFQKKQKLKQRQLEKDMEKDCSFKPSLMSNKKYQNVTSNYRQSEDISNTIQEQQRQKQQRIENLKKQREVSELQSCTFQPELIEKRIEETEEEVKGLERFLELKDMARKNQLEKQQRERKAFLMELPYDPNRSVTVPEPFKLHPSTKNQRLQKMQSELSHKFTQECTFKPKTIEA